MPRVVGVDHLVLSVGDFARSKEYYGKLLGFLGFKLKNDYEDMAGWSNGKTLFWIAAADTQGKKHKYRKGDVGFSRKERPDGDRSARRILWQQLLRGLFHRSRRHEA